MRTLDQLIRRIERNQYGSRDRGHFVYDAERDVFEPRPPRFFGGNMEYFEVVCSRAAVPDASGTCGPVGVSDPSTGTLLHIHFGYSAWILPENAEHVLHAVVRRNRGYEVQRREKFDPGERLLEIVVEAVQGRATAEIGALLDGHPERVNLIARELEREILQDYGLSLSLVLMIDAAPIALPEIDTNVKIRLRDYSQELSLQIRVLMSVQRRDSVRAKEAMKLRPHLKETIEGTCRDFFLDVTIHRFRKDLDGPIQRDLGRRLESDVSSWFLALRSLDLREMPSDLPPVDFKEVTTAFSIEIRGYPRQVQIHTRIQLELANEALYDRRGRQGLQDWVDKTVPPIVQRILFDVRYSKLCMEFFKLEARILEDLQRAALEIGYNVKAQITTPGLPESEFLRPFAVEVEDEFATAVDIVSSRLRLVLRTQLEDLASVTAELDRGEDLKKDFEEVVLQETRAYLHTVQPAFLFTRFSPARDLAGQLSSVSVETTESQRSLEEELRERIKDALAERFGLRIHSFTAKQGKSEIRDCYLALIRAPKLMFEVAVHLRGHGELVTHFCAVKVKGIDVKGWSIFQNVLPSVEDVREFAQDTMNSLIARAQAERPHGITEAEARKIAEQKLLEEMIRLHGLAVQTLSWHRATSSMDAKLGAAYQAAAQEDLTYRLEMTRADRAKLAELEKTRRRQLALGQTDLAAKTQAKIDEARQSNESGMGMFALPWSQGNALALPQGENAKDISDHDNSIQKGDKEK